jgi:enoyl-CoA hydratase/carnithine racemase
VPRRHLDEVVLGAGLYSPAEACLLGLVDEVADDALAAATRHLEALARHPPAADAAAKRGLRAGVLDVSPQERRRFEAEGVPIWASAALRERIRAHLAR